MRKILNIVMIFILVGSLVSPIASNAQDLNTSTTDNNIRIVPNESMVSSFQDDADSQGVTLVVKNNYDADDNDTIFIPSSITEEDTSLLSDFNLNDGLQVREVRSLETNTDYQTYKEDDTESQSSELSYLDSYAFEPVEKLTAYPAGYCTDTAACSTQYVSSPALQTEYQAQANSDGITLQVIDTQTATGSEVIYFPDANLVQGLMDASSTYSDRINPDFSDGVSVSELSTPNSGTGLYLNLYSKNITDITGLEYIANNTSLTSLDLSLSGNQISDIDELGTSMQYLTSLTSLDLSLSGNQISDIDELGTSMQYLTSLTSLALDLQNNQISDIDNLGTSMQYLRSLTYLM